MQPNIEGGLGWMAWTWQTALFFGVIAALLVLMTVLELRRPGGAERRGVLGLVTTRGDRLFISLLAAGFVHLLWLAFFGSPLWGASALALVVAWLVFRYV
jgi:predicted small integral membrane protein